MEYLKPIESVLGFLTILPVGKQNHDLYYVAKSMYLFPAAGLVIGAIIGAIAFGVSNFLHPMLVGFLVAGALIIITGVHHTDALTDFADGLMAKGSKESKHRAMLDPAVGSAGVAALVMYFAGMIIVFNIGFESSLAIFTSMITAEVIAKYVMVMLAYRSL
ncbi:MAG TPA: adenosylcobinamide-GDP ribazoletransferase, partial [Nitrososphaera sp.]